jgi:tetratricopeptide (TPR) repeat protein
MELARGKADYHLLLDADMTLIVHAEFRHKLSADAYLIRHEGDLDYWVERLVSDRHAWRYVGPTHEYICSETARTKEKLPELSVKHYCDGSSRPMKYQRDIELLKAELERAPTNARGVFYLAQSYRDLGNLPQAIEWYEKRAAMGGWEEEVWYALYQVAVLQHRLGWAWPLVLNAYLVAYQYRPTRLEPLYRIARFYRENGQLDLAYLFGRQGDGARYPDDILFVEREIYEHGFALEHALACAGSGRQEEATRALDEILAVSSVPESVRETARRHRARVLVEEPPVSLTGSELTDPIRVHLDPKTGSGGNQELATHRS